MFVDENWINPASSQWTHIALGYLGWGTKLNEIQLHCTVTKTSPEGNSKLTHIPILHPSQSPLIMQQSIRNQVLLLELHPLSIPFCTHPPYYYLIRPQRAPHLQAFLNPSRALKRNFPLRRMALSEFLLEAWPWGEKKKEEPTAQVATLYSCLCLEDYRPLPPHWSLAFPHT